MKGSTNGIASVHKHPVVGECTKTELTLRNERLHSDRVMLSMTTGNRQSCSSNDVIISTSMKLKSVFAC